MDSFTIRGARRNAVDNKRKKREEVNGDGFHKE